MKRFFTLENSSYKIVRSNAGSINYSKGEILLSPVNIISTLKQKSDDNVIEISAIPKSNDVIGLQDLYLQLDIGNSSLTTLEDSISSGSDISGTQYNSTSSYLNGSLIRN